jgi:hypothetical protein
MFDKMQKRFYRKMSTKMGLYLCRYMSIMAPSVAYKKNFGQKRNLLMHKITTLRPWGIEQKVCKQK